MKHKIFSHTSLLIILSVILTFLAAGTVMYNRYDIYMKQGVRDEAAYIKTGLEEDGDVFLSDRVGDATSSRITLLGKDGQVLFDSIENPEEMENHSNRPEFIEAEKQGSGEMVRYSDTLSKQTFYYAVKLKDDQVLRVARTTDSLLVTMLTSFLLLGGLVCVILVIELFLVQKQTRKLIEPINRIDLEHPLEHVCYEELRPLLFRLDQQNRQIQKQLEDLKNAESARKEFTANVSHELKTPLMSISGYAELMMNGMVPPDKEDVRRVGWHPAVVSGRTAPAGAERFPLHGQRTSRRQRGHHQTQQQQCHRLHGIRGLLPLQGGLLHQFQGVLRHL